MGFVQGSYFCRLIFEDVNFDYCYALIYDIGLRSDNVKFAGNNNTAFQKICSFTTEQEYTLSGPLTGSQARDPIISTMCSGKPLFWQTPL